MKPYTKALNSKTLEQVLRWGVIGLLIWLAVMVLGAGAQSLNTSGKAATAIREYERIRTEAATSGSDSREKIRTLSQNNLFVAVRTRTQLPQTQAILGDSVLIGDRWYREGQVVQGYEILQVGPDFVTILNDGKEERIVPFDVAVNYGQTGRSQGGTAGGGDRGDRGGAAGGAGMRGRGGPAGGGDEARTAPPQRPGGPGADMMDMRTRVEAMTPQQRQETFERFRNASPEEREQMREEFMRGRE